MRACMCPCRSAWTAEKPVRVGSVRVVSGRIVGLLRRKEDDERASNCVRPSGTQVRAYPTQDLSIHPVCT